MKPTNTLEKIIKVDTALIPGLQKLAELYKSLWIDGVCYVGGIGMTMSCIGTPPTALIAHVSEPEAIERNKLHEVRTYIDEDENIRTLPGGLKIWIHAEVLEDLEEDEEFDHLEFVFLNLDHDPPLFYVDMC